MYTAANIWNEYNKQKAKETHTHSERAHIQSECVRRTRWSRVWSCIQRTERVDEQISTR